MIIDIIVLAVLLISAVIAFLRGFIREVLTIAGVVGGLAAAYIGGPLLKPHMRDWMGVEEGIEPERLFGILPYDVVADALSYGGIFIVVVIILSIISHFLAETAKSMGLGAIDRTFGFIFGILRGIILLGLLYLPVHLFIDQDSKDKWFESSKTHFYLEKTSDALSDLIPSETSDALEENLKETGETLKGASETRKKLEEINLLPGNAPTQDFQNTPSENEGYSDEFRNKMDKLFENETETTNE